MQHSRDDQLTTRLFVLPGTCGLHELPRTWPHTPDHPSIVPEPLHPEGGVPAERSLDSNTGIRSTDFSSSNINFTPLGEGGFLEVNVSNCYTSKTVGKGT